MRMPVFTYGARAQMVWKRRKGGHLCPLWMTITEQRWCLMTFSFLTYVCMSCLKWLIFFTMSNIMTSSEIWQPWAHSRLLLAYLKCLTIIFGYTDEKPLPKLLVCASSFAFCELHLLPSGCAEGKWLIMGSREKIHLWDMSRVRNFLSTRTGTQLRLIIGEGAVHLFHSCLSYSYTTLTFCLWDWNCNRKDIRARNVEIQYPRINFVLHYEA